MEITIVGSGDAFGTGGRAHTCFRARSGEAGALVDFGAASISSWKKLGLSFDSVDLIAFSHLHGDHFGGLPFLLLDCQFVERRTKPLLIAGPPGTRDRLDALFELLFPGNARMNWGFAWRVDEIQPGAVAKAGAFELESFPVVHAAGSIATGLRLGDGRSVFAYSGDTAWTETLLAIAAEADLFICECYSGDKPVPNHMDWPTLKTKLPGFTAKRVMVTHMSASALAQIADMEAAGLMIAYDGQTIEL